MIRGLPPPPQNPLLAPARLVLGEVPVRIPGLAGGPALSGLAHVPEGAQHAVLLCHPHPLYGGSMHAAVILTMTRALQKHAGAGVAWLRFDMRGVGESEGISTGDAHEIQDAASALSWLVAQAPAARLSVCGYSFGSFTGLAAAEQLGRSPSFVFVAPVPRAFPYSSHYARTLPLRHVLVGDHDEFCSEDEARALAETFDAPIEFVPGASHALLAHRGKIAERVASLLIKGPSTLAPSPPA